MASRWDYNVVLIEANKLRERNESVFNMIYGIKDNDDKQAHNSTWAVRNVAAPIPEPSTWLLLGSALVGMVLYRRRQGLISLLS